MRIKRTIIFFVTVLLFPECILAAITKEKPINSPSGKNYKIVCNFHRLDYNEEESVRFDIEDIDPYQCTHLIYDYDFADDDKPIRSHYPRIDINEAKTGDFVRFSNLKRINSELKTLLHVELTKYEEYLNIVSSREKRKNFIDSYVELLKKYNFDGLDFNWEFYFHRRIQENLEKLFTLLLEMREEFNKHSLLITAPIHDEVEIIRDGYDLSQLYKYIDFFKVVSFGYHNYFDNYTCHASGLYARPDESSNNIHFNVNYTINYLISKGVPREKLILGLNFRGNYFILNDEKKNGLYEQARYNTTKSGGLRYDEICEKQRIENWTVVRDPYYMAPYAYYESHWVSYEDIESISLKVEYAKNMKLGGAMVWSVATDDFRGTCNGEKNPLLTAINKGFQSDTKPMPTPPQVTEATTED